MPLLFKGRIVHSRGWKGWANKADYVTLRTLVAQQIHASPHHTVSVAKSHIAVLHLSSSKTDWSTRYDLNLTDSVEASSDSEHGHGIRLRHSAHDAALIEKKLRQQSPEQRGHHRHLHVALHHSRKHKRVSVFALASFADQSDWLRAFKLAFAHLAENRKKRPSLLSSVTASVTDDFRDVKALVVGLVVNKAKPDKVMKHLRDMLQHLTSGTPTVRVQKSHAFVHVGGIPALEQLRAGLAQQVGAAGKRKNNKGKKKKATKAEMKAKATLAQVEKAMRQIQQVLEEHIPGGIPDSMSAMSGASLANAVQEQTTEAKAALHLLRPGADSTSKDATLQQNAKAAQGRNRRAHLRTSLRLAVRMVAWRERHVHTTSRTDVEREVQADIIASGVLLETGKSKNNDGVVTGSGTSSGKRVVSRTSSRRKSQSIGMAAASKNAAKAEKKTTNQSQPHQQTPSAPVPVPAPAQRQAQARRPAFVRLKRQGTGIPGRPRHGLSPGNRIQATGGSREGQEGKVVTWDTKKSRWVVRWDLDGAKSRYKPTNLERLSQQQRSGVPKEGEEEGEKSAHTNGHGQRRLRNKRRHNKRHLDADTERAVKISALRAMQSGSMRRSKLDTLTFAEKMARLRAKTGGGHFFRTRDDDDATPGGGGKMALGGRRRGARRKGKGKLGAGAAAIKKKKKWKQPTRRRRKDGKKAKNNVVPALAKHESEIPPSTPPPPPPPDDNDDATG